MFQVDSWFVTECEKRIAEYDTVHDMRRMNTEAQRHTYWNAQHVSHSRRSGLENALIIKHNVVTLVDWREIFAF
jgi:hypothetical protein